MWAIRDSTSRPGQGPRITLITLITYTSPGQTNPNSPNNFQQPHHRSKARKLDEALAVAREQELLSRERAERAESAFEAAREVPL